MKHAPTSLERYQDYKSQGVDLIVAPWGFGGTDNLAQEGAHSLLTDHELAQRLMAIGLEVKEIHPPSLGPFEVQDEANKIRNLKSILTVNNWLADTVKLSITNKQIPIVLGGDGSLSLASATAAVEVYGKNNFGIIWLSNHLCNSSPRVTKSWNANRMIFTVLSFDKEPKHPDFKTLMNFRNLGNPILPKSNIVHIGINHKSAQELVDHGFFTMEDLDELGARVVINRAIDQLKHCQHIHLIWDLNVLDLSAVSNFSLGQLDYREALAIAREIDVKLRRQGRLSSIDIVEYCPSKEAWDRRGEATEWASDILTNIFGENILNAARKY
jgi:arginase family enzyme